MSKPTLDEIEVDIIQLRMYKNRNEWLAAREGSQERKYYENEIKRDQRRHHDLTGRWYDYSYTMPRLEEQAR